ncbi:MAG: TetR/AcrR family transcriptional regulator [Solirubrobacterales bacterium]
MAPGSRTKAKRAPEPARRRVEIADAALRVLAAEGSRGLTHRAVDEAAGLPSGSTSNHFRTREALLEAAAARHAELDMPPAEAVAALEEATLTRAQARELVLAGLGPIVDPQNRELLMARYELILEATRRPALHEVMEGSRARFVELAELLLRATGCKTPRAHAAQLIALLDGIAADQLQASASTLGHAGIEEAVDHFLACC